ncbi:MAG: GTP-binding protein [Ferrovum sp.]|jgi:sulfate adenylyltransferase subunit 1|nr:GTP-binding protein [Ferrovum sp.]NDU90650.1 GTP-binding protein [Ferrovum sp.]
MENKLKNCQELLRFITCGSVDDGKSTLIGRLLLDSRSVLADQWAAIEATSTRRGQAQVDLSLLTDGLQAEREQGITIDVAYRYFSTPARRFIIADTPGHAQYTRNMVTGASTADLAILLLDARKGVVEQTRRHAQIVRLLGIRKVVIAVNKMDLVAYGQEAFERVKQEFLNFAEPLDFRDIVFIPLSALNGDGVVLHGEHMPWYTGPTLLELLETVVLDEEILNSSFRFPIQLVTRLSEENGEERRGAQGRVESGTVAVGDEVLLLPSGRTSRVSAIETYAGRISQARAGQSITLVLADQIDMSRGDMIASVAHPPRTGKNFEALVCWFSHTPYDPARRLLIQQTTRCIQGKIETVSARLDIQTSQLIPSPAQVAMNDLVHMGFKVQQPLAFDRYEDNRTTGSFILIDALTHDTVAAGMIV